MQNYPLYQHRQRALVNLVLMLVPMLVVFIVMPAVLRAHGQADAIPQLVRFSPLVGVVLIAAGVFLSSLEVTVQPDCLTVRFGPGVYRKSWPIADITHVHTVRTTLAAGFGVHRWQGAWVYNVSGFDAVRVHFKDGSSIIIGSNDAIRLAHVLERTRPRA